MEAVDLDPPDSGGTVMFSIVEVTTEDFSVDPATGWVRTKKVRGPDPGLNIHDHGRFLIN